MVTLEDTENTENTEDIDLDAEAGPEMLRAHRFPLVVRTQRVLQIVLGLFWLLDAALQFQPFMFGQGFVGILQANASGQPFVVGDLITHLSSFLSPDIAVWNTFFALIQVAIALGLLYRRTVRPALVLSFVWVLGVWFFGEGMGMLLTGTASALTGAPGSVLMYGLLGLMAWPRSRTRSRSPRHGRGHDDEPETDADLVGVASSAAAQGIGRSVTPLAVWAGYWSLAAVLFLLPDNRTSTSVHSAIAGMVPSQPGWYGHVLSNISNQFTSTGTQWAWILAAASLVVGLAPLVVRRAGPWLFAGAVFAFVMWMSGQGLFGNVFSGSDTDPNTGLIVILLAAAMVPAVVAAPGARSWRSPAAVVFRRVPALAALVALGLGAALALAATYPPAAPESAGSAMSGMDMGGSAAAAAPGASASAATCHPNQIGLKISGLDLANTPYMIMSGTNGMDMNGADAERGGRAEHDQGRVALHRSCAAGLHRQRAGAGRQQRARRHPHGAQRVLARCDLVAGDRGRAVRAADQLGSVGLRHAGRSHGRRLRTRVADELPGRLLRQPCRRRRQRRRPADAQPGARRRAGLRHHTVGAAGPRRGHVHPPGDRERRPDAVRTARAVAPAPRRVRHGDDDGHHAPGHQRLPAVCRRIAARAHAVPVHGLAGARRRGPAGHSAARPPDRGGGGDAALHRVVRCSGEAAVRPKRRQKGAKRIKRMRTAARNPPFG